MNNFDQKKYPLFANFLNKLAKDLTKFYYSKLNRTFKVSNKLRGKGYDPVTTTDKAFEKFIRSKIKNKFPDHQVIGEEFGYKKSKSDFTWVIDPIDGTRSYVIGNPTWSNLISLNYKGSPILGLANFPILKKYYLNYSDKTAYVVENGKKRKINVNKKAMSYVVSDVGLNYKLDNIKFSVKIDNLFDKNYYHYNSYGTLYPLPGINYVGAISYEF